MRMKRQAEENSTDISITVSDGKERLHIDGQIGLLARLILALRNDAAWSTTKTREEFRVDIRAPTGESTK